MTYLVLILIIVLAGLGWLYYEYIYPFPDENEKLAFGIECDLERFGFADECKRVFLVVIVFCVFLGAIFGASEL
jgi:hypothetical protein